MSDRKAFAEIWEAVRLCMRKSGRYSETTMSLWFDDVELVMVTDDRAVLLCSTKFKRDVIKRNYTESLTELFRDALGFAVEIDIRSEDEVDDILKSIEEEYEDEEQHKRELPTSFEELTEDPEDYYLGEGENRILNYAAVSMPSFTDFTFENFVVGASNKFAYAACLAVANDPKRGYNPLFIYAPPGLGKTHLLYAIIDRIKEDFDGLNIVYVKGEKFTNQLIDAIARNRTAEFRDRYRRADVLLIDDIQFIAGKEATQEEFFHTFNDLYENNKRIILTSDRPPRDIPTLEERLKSRFEWGLMADIKAPDLELRTAILKHKAAMMGMTLPQEVLSYVAENLKHNVRQLEGAVKKIAAQSFLSGQQITVDLAIGCIADLITPSEPVSVTVDKIIDVVSKHYGITVEDLKSKKRTAAIAMARHVAIYMIRNMTDMSLPAIAKVFSRDHTTIMASLDKVEAEMKGNAALDVEIRELMKGVKE